jgi:prolyl-tRNA synthetase
MEYDIMNKKEGSNSFSSELGIKVEQDKISEWYNKIIKEAGLVDQGPARGTIVLRPYGFALWKQIQKFLGDDIEKNDVKDVYFPAIIPENLLTKEKEHIEGFAPEFLRVQSKGDIIGVLRPTSEAVMYPLFAKWIHSYRVPLKINQWCNVFRDELRPYAFMRTTEFLWQEGHCVYSSSKENEEAVMNFLKMYEKCFNNNLALAPIFGKKSEKEKFAGAVYTTTGEAVLPGGKVLQVCTSHNLGKNFAEAFNIQFLDKDGKLKYPYQTSWGLSWRVIGAMIMTHGDKKGLIFPPEMAPTQVVIIPIRGGTLESKVFQVAKEIRGELSNFKVELDESEERPGVLYNYHELRGVPLRIEIGARDIENNQVIAANRLTGEKKPLSLKNLKGNVRDILTSIQKSLLEKAQNSTQENIHDVEVWKEFNELINTKQPGFLRTYHCGDRVCEQQIQDETKATLRCIPFGYQKSDGLCVRCGKPSAYGQKVIFAKAY